MASGLGGRSPRRSGGSEDLRQARSGLPGGKPAKDAQCVYTTSGASLWRNVCSIESGCTVVEGESVLLSMERTGHAEERCVELRRVKEGGIVVRNSCLYHTDCRPARVL